MPNENVQSLKRFVAESPGTIAMFDRDLRYLAASERWSSDFNVGQNLIGLSHYEVFPEITDAWKAVHRRALAGETVRADREAFRRLDGTTQWLQWAVWPWLDSESQVGGVIMSSFDLTDQVAAQNVDPGGEAAELTKTPPAPWRSPEQRAIIGELRTANLILNNLPQALFDHLADHLTPVALVPNTVLVDAQHVVSQVHFPLSGLNTVIRYLEDGAAAEIATGGRGGFVGLSVIVDDGHEENEIRVLLKGIALVIDAKVLRDAMAAWPAIRAVLMKFNAMLLALMSVSMTCMARHGLDQRLARWLLTASDRLGDVRLDIGQETLAMLLSVRRTGISEALNRLAAAGVIDIGRGHVVIRDRARLEARSCECYREAEAARRRSTPDVVVSSAIPSPRLRELVDRFERLASQRSGTPPTVAAI